MVGIECVEGQSRDPDPLKSGSPVYRLGPGGQAKWDQEESEGPFYELVLPASHKTSSS